MVNGRIWIFGGLTAVLAAAAYVFYGPKQRRRRKRDIVPGLHNLGNLCFLNAVLQALAPCHTIVAWLAAVNHHFHQRTRPDKGRLLDALFLCLEVLNSQSNVDSEVDTFSPESILLALQANRWVIAYDEQDSHELFHVLTTTLKEEYDALPSVMSLSDVKQLESEPPGGQALNVITKCCHNMLPVAKRFEFPAQGLLASQLKCRECGFKNPVHFDTFDSISLAVPTPSLDSPPHIYNCLQGFTSPELVHHVTCEGCSHAKNQADSDGHSNSSAEVKSVFIKQLTVGKLPRCLCFHIKRTIWLSNGIPVKRFDHVSFPEHLVMDDYLYHCTRQPSSRGQDGHQPWLCLLGGTNATLSSPKRQEPVKSTIADGAVTSILEQHGLQNQPAGINYPSKTYPRHVYRLQSVVVHQGDTFSGHFLTYRRGPLDSPSNRRWFCTSDSSVREVPFSEVLQAAAYMLLYERINSLPSV